MSCCCNPADAAAHLNAHLTSHVAAHVAVHDAAHVAAHVVAHVAAHVVAHVAVHDAAHVAAHDAHVAAHDAVHDAAHVAAHVVAHVAVHDAAHVAAHDAHVAAHDAAHIAAIDLAMSPVRHSLTDVMARSIVVVLMQSRLDYCNSLLFGVSSFNLDKLQRLHHLAARLVMTLNSIQQKSIQRLFVKIVNLFTPT